MTKSDTEMNHRGKPLSMFGESRKTTDTSTEKSMTFRSSPKGRQSSSSDSGRHQPATKETTTQKQLPIDANSDPRVKFMDVTPTIAKKWLDERNANNRPINQEHVAMLAKAMRDGEFHTTHQGIAFDSEGNLADGQHRLAAILASGITVRLMVTAGLPPIVRGDIDTGVIRRLHHQLKLVYGERSAKKVVSWLIVLSELTGEFAKKMTAADAERTINQYRDDIEWGLSLPQRRGINAPVVASLVYAHGADSKKVDEFARLLLDGANIPKKSPVLALQRLIIADPKPDKAGRSLQASRTLRAVINHIRGQLVERLTTTGEEIEYFRRARKAKGR